MAESTPRKRYSTRMADHIIVYAMNIWEDGAKRRGREDGPNGSDTKQEVVLLFNNKHRLWHCVDCAANDCEHVDRIRRTVGG